MNSKNIYTISDLLIKAEELNMKANTEDEKKISNAILDFIMPFYDAEMRNSSSIQDEEDTIEWNSNIENTEYEDDED